VRGLGNPQSSAARIIVVMRAPLGKHASGPEVPHGTSGTTSSKASTPNYNTVPLFDVSDAVSAQHVPRRASRIFGTKIETMRFRLEVGAARDVSVCAAPFRKGGTGLESKHPRLCFT